MGSYLAKDCTAQSVSFPANTEFPSRRIQKSLSHGGRLFRGKKRGSNFDLRGRNRGKHNSLTNSQKESVYKKVKMTDINGKEKFVMLSETDGQIYELIKSIFIEGELYNVSVFNNVSKINLNNISFITDSGATEHIVHNKSILNNMLKVNGGVIRCANKNSSADVKIERVGDLNIQTEGGKSVILQNVLYAPDIAQNIISLRKVINSGIKVVLSREGIKFISKTEDKIIMEGIYYTRFWYLNFKQSRNSSNSKNYLHSTLASKIKTIPLGQGITNLAVFPKEQIKIISEHNMVQKEGSNDSFRNNSKASIQNICDESFRADVEEEHNYAIKLLATNECKEERNSIIDKGNTYARSLDQVTKE